MYLGLYSVAVLISVVSLFSIPYALYCIGNHTAYRERLISATTYELNHQRARTVYITASLSACTIFVTTLVLLRVI